MMKLSERLAEALRAIDKPIDKESYAFLDKAPEAKKPVLIGLGGSHAYGTNIPTSDLDLRGIAMHSKEDVLLNRGFEQFVNEQTDTVIYSLEKAVKLFSVCNPNMIEMLGLKKEHYIYMTDIGWYLYDNRDMFLSNRCVGTFMGYANSQLYKLRQKTTHCLPDEDKASLSEHIVKVLNGMRANLEDEYDLKDVSFGYDGNDIVVDLNVKGYSFEKLIAALGIFDKTIGDYNRRSKRNDYALTHEKIAKHSMHLLRLYMMCEDLLLKGEINTFREKEHDLLMDIRNKKYLRGDGQPTQEFFDMVAEYENRLEYAKEHSILPNKPNIKKIDKFLIDANMSLFE